MFSNSYMERRTFCLKNKGPFILCPFPLYFKIVHSVCPYQGRSNLLFMYSRDSVTSVIRARHWGHWGHLLSLFALFHPWETDWTGFLFFLANWFDMSTCQVLGGTCRQGCVLKWIATRTNPVNIWRVLENDYSELS